ncbi:MAG: hypothetical protein MR557_07835 [Faecalibacterium sp.]|nr:hypothetical protein [Faecalibacterium sp.]
MLKIAVKRKKDANLICKLGAGFTSSVACGDSSLWEGAFGMAGRFLVAFDTLKQG